MKALMCHSFGPVEDLKVETIATPSPAAGEVLIAVRAAALNYPDALIVQGRYQVRPPLPFVPGAEMAGTVVAVGEGVSAPVVGEAVIASAQVGAFAEYCVVPADKAIALPAGFDFEQGAALLLTYGTALHALKDRAALGPGETLVVLGAAGGVGLAAIEIGKALGARVIAAASSEEKRALCRSVGADDTIDYSREDLKARLLELTDGYGADVVFDPVGGDYTESAVRALGWRGRLLVVGFAAGTIPALALNLALLKERAVLGVYWGDAVRRDREQHVRNVALLSQWRSEGKLCPVITERVALGGVAIGMAALLGRRVMGKVVVLPGRE